MYWLLADTADASSSLARKENAEMSPPSIAMGSPSAEPGPEDVSGEVAAMSMSRNASISSSTSTRRSAV